MKREFIMISIIIALVIVGHIFTQKYTQDFFEEIENDLNELREQILIASEDNNKNNIELKNKYNNAIKDNMNSIKSKWNNKYNILAYYTEHDELEKVGAEFALINGYIELEEYTNSTAEIDRTIFILHHISDKDNFRLVNIF